MFQIEQLNIEGKRSGSGFVAHKATLVSALSRALAERVVLQDITIGRKGFLGYLKALAGSNIVKVVPAADSASEPQAIGKRLRVSCGSNTSFLDDLAWVGDKTPLTLCEVRICPKRTVKPNLGSLELTEALNRVLPFTAREDSKPVLQCVLFMAKDGKLTLVSADGYRLAVVKLDYDGDEGQVLIPRDELRGIANALRKAHRVNLSITGVKADTGGESASGGDAMSLVIDTELTRYRWRGADGTFPDYEKLIPTGANTVAHFDTVEAVRAVSSLKALADSKSYPIDLTLDDGTITMTSPDDKGRVTIPADTEGGAIRVRIEGGYLTEALRACGGMVDFKLTDAQSPMLFSHNGYQLVVMPMFAGESQQPKGEAQTAEPEAEKAQAVAEAEAITRADKPKRSRKRETVAVAWNA